MESLAGDSGRTSYMSAVSEAYSFALPFEYDQDDDEYDLRRRTTEQELRAQRIQEAYLREKTPSPPPTRVLPNPPVQQQQQQQQPQPPRNPVVYQQQAHASSSQGSGFRVPAPPRSFPFQEDPEFDDEVIAQKPVPPQPQPQPQVQPQQQPQPQVPSQPQRWVSQSRERERERAPSPPPAPPSTHPPIPLFSPQSVNPAQPPVLARHDDSTPSPPAAKHAPLRVNPSAPTQQQQQQQQTHREEELEPAEASSDHFTPKSPNAPLPADYGYHYTNNNVGRLGAGGAGRGMPNIPPYYDPYGVFQHHTMLANPLAGMAPPRGPHSNLGNYAREGFTSLAGAAAALSKNEGGRNVESPYPAPPQINTNVNGSSQSGYGGSAESGGHGHVYDPPWDGPHISYSDFVDLQGRAYAAGRPDAPIPPTPQSQFSPQQAHPSSGPNSANAGRRGSHDQNQGQGQNQGQNQNQNGQNGYPNVPAYGNGYGPGAYFDPSRVPDRYIPSALSSYLSSPMMHNPFLPRYPPPASLVSSPSHIPLDLPPAPIGGRKLHKKKSKRQLRGTASGGSGPGGKAGSSVPKTSSRLAQPPVAPPPPEPPRVGAESTVPRDSSTEESDTDDTKKGSIGKKPPTTSQPSNTLRGSGVETEEEEEDDDEVWLEESSEDEMDVEFHSRYIQNPSKRKRKWEQKWDAMIRLFQELDRTTDSPMIVLASPSTSSGSRMHILVSRAIQRNPTKYMPHAQVARQSFAEISKLRRKEKQEAAAAERAKRAAGFEQQLAGIGFLGPRFDEGSGGSPGGRGSSSPGSVPGLAALERLQDLPQLAAGGEDGLKQALGVALESLKQMHMIYEQREERRREEAERQRQEAAGLEMLFNVLQSNQQPNSGSPASTGKASLSGKKSP